MDWKFRLKSTKSALFSFYEYTGIWTIFRRKLQFNLFLILYIVSKPDLYYNFELHFCIEEVVLLKQQIFKKRSVRGYL